MPKQICRIIIKTESHNSINKDFEDEARATEIFNTFQKNLDEAEKRGVSFIEFAIDEDRAFFRVDDIKAYSFNKFNIATSDEIEALREARESIGLSNHSNFRNDFKSIPAAYSGMLG